MSIRLSHYFFAVVFLLICAIGNVTAQLPPAPKEFLPVGTVIEKVVCQDNAEQSYALYLPSSFKPDQKMPIIYAFDPGARGQLPVNAFKSAAERYGYIIVGSNNSQNGPFEVSGNSMQAMLDDTQTRFNIDQDRIYLTGFSGGARVASQIGFLLKGRAAGVIACGAGFPSNADLAQGVPFLYAAITGIDDFNYDEIRELDRKLQENKIPRNLEVFIGGHAWPPESVCLRAIEWLELQALKAGKRSKDDKLLDELFNRSVENARQYETNGLLIQALESYKQLSRDFKDLKNTDEFEKKVATLRESKEYKQALKQEEEQITEQRKKLGELFALRERAKQGTRDDGLSQTDVTNSPTSNSNRVSRDGGEFIESDSNSFKALLANLKKRAEAKEFSTNRTVARRVLNQYLIISYERVTPLLREKRYTEAAATLELDAEFLPDNGYSLYRLACAYALAGNKKKALDALKKATRNGFKDRGEIEKNPDLDPLRGEKDYKKLLESI